MYALTLWQPWAWAVACGLKRIDNRTWEPPASLLNRRFAIHAARRYDELSAETLWRLLDHGNEPTPPRKEEAVLGSILATCELIGVVTDPVSAQRLAGTDGTNQWRWFFGPYGWVLSGVRQLSEPLPCHGHQRLWRVPSEIEVVLADV